MKNLLITIFSATILAFGGCAAATKVEASGVAEPTGDVSTYLRGAYVDAATAKANLTSGGFEVLSEFESVENGKTIVFTCPKLKAEAAKPNRAHIATMRLFVDDESKSIAVTNPVYFGKAYMQDDYNHATFSAISAKIEKAFPGLTPSEDKMAFKNLAKFHFTIGMPYYEDKAIVGEDSNENLLAKAKKYSGGKAIAYELKLSEKTTIVGYGLGSGTKRFVKKIGRQNAALMPYDIVLNDGKASILKAEYYIALYYPLLGMGQFMGIASVPGDIIKDLSKPFGK